MLLHEEVLRLFTLLAERLGTDGLARFVYVSVALIAGPVLLLTGRGARRRWGARGVRATLGAVAVACIAWVGLGTIAAELVHYIQYALFAALLVRARHSLLAAGCITVALGGLDELYQCVILFPERALDLPDVGLDAAGAVLGLLIAGSTRAPDGRSKNPKKGFRGRSVRGIERPRRGVLARGAPDDASLPRSQDLPLKPPPAESDSGGMTAGANAT